MCVCVYGVCVVYGVCCLCVQCVCVCVCGVSVWSMGGWGSVVAVVCLGVEVNVCV